MIKNENLCMPNENIGYFLEYGTFSPIFHQDSYPIYCWFLRSNLIYNTFWGGQSVTKVSIKYLVDLLNWNYKIRTISSLFNVVFYWQKVTFRCDVCVYLMFIQHPPSVNKDQAEWFNITWCGVWIIVEVIMARQIIPAGL